MKTKAEVLLKNMNRLYQNIYNLLEAFHAANTTNSTNITAKLENEDGSVQEVNVKSYQRLINDIVRLDNNFKSLFAPESYVVGADGNITKYAKISYLNAQYLNDFSFDINNCIVDRNGLIDDLVYPLIKLPIQINQDIIESKINCKIYEISRGWDVIPENPKEINLQWLQDNGDIDFVQYNKTLDVVKQEIQYFGEFKVLNVEAGSEANEFNLILDNIQYTSKSVIGNSISLKIGNILVTESGTSKYQITDVNDYTKWVKVTRIGGMEVPKDGVKLLFNQIFESNNKVVQIPIKPVQKLVIFLSTENDNFISYPSNGLKLDTTDFKVSHNETSYTIDEFFAKYVTNFSQYLTMIADNTNIPFSLGIQPNKPELLSQNFKVVQINKHLIDNAVQQTMTELNKKKQLIQNDIDYKQSTIDTIQKEINTLKFSSVEEKSYRVNKIVELRTEINTLKANLLTVTRDIDTNAIKYGLKNTKPKYKVIGFWDIQEPIYCPQTTPQHIIKYDVQYRYLQKEVDVSDTTTYKIISNGKEIVVAFSNWNELATRTLSKIKDINGDYTWEENAFDSINDININQCAITISENESIEIRIRAVSEAGYPLSAMKSEWSEPLRIDFPDSLKANNLQATISQNNVDLNKAEFNAILQNLGVLNHIAGTIQENEKIFYHSAKDIASGQFTAEQKNIPLDECIKSIMQDIKILKSTDINDNIVVSLVDFNDETYEVKNQSTFELFAGNYTDSLDLLNTETFGEIIRKRCYIKIRNNNSIPVEIRSLVPGTSLNQVNAPNYYNAPIKYDGIINSEGVQQISRQVFYLRNTDLIGTTINRSAVSENSEYSLVVARPIWTAENPQDKSLFANSEIDGSTSTNNKLIGFDGTTVTNSFNLKNYGNGEYLLFGADHPFVGTPKINDEFIRLRKVMSPLLKEQQVQGEITAASTNDMVGFSDYDKYAVGRYTCGAWLYPLIPNIQKFLVNGNTSISSLIINKESELLIPIMFEYRMTDHLGYIDGNPGFDINQGLEYSKKIGFDILINNSVFSFDLKVTAKLLSKISNTDISSIIANYNNESQEILY